MVSLEIKKDLMLKVKPIRILDRSEKELRNKKILMINILWRSSQVEEETWKKEWENVNPRSKFYSVNKTLKI
jgi:hypothetical protein